MHSRAGTMSLVSMYGATPRQHAAIFLAAAIATLAASPARGQASTVCATCVTRDSARMRPEQLLVRIDSLRFEFEHSRLNDADRVRLSNEMGRTMVALQRAFGESRLHMRTRAPSEAITSAEGEEHIALFPRAMAFNYAQGPRIRGYLGVTFDGPSIEEANNRERLIRFLEYPRISMVEPSSPAERAGIQEGDTLVALNGSDVRNRQLSLTKLLVPEQRIVVRVRRDGGAKDFRVKVDTSPDYMIRRAQMAPMIAMPPMGPLSPTAP